MAAAMSNDSSSSFLPASAFAVDVAGRVRCLVVHPGNPPDLLRCRRDEPAFGELGR